MSAQLNTFINTDFTGQNERVRAYIERHPQQSIAQIAAAMGLQKSSTSRAVNDLKWRGCIIVTQRTTGDVYAFDPDPTNWPGRITDLARQKQLKRIQLFVADFTPYLDATTTEGLRRLWSMVNAKPL